MSVAVARDGDQFSLLSSGGRCESNQRVHRLEKKQEDTDSSHSILVHLPALEQAQAAGSRMVGLVGSHETVGQLTKHPDFTQIPIVLKFLRTET